MNDAITLICDECGQLVREIGYLKVDVAEAEEQLRFGIREGLEDENQLGDDDYDYEELTREEKRQRSLAVALHVRWEKLRPLKTTQWRVCHERCDRNMRATDYRLSVWEVNTFEKLVLRLAYISETQNWFVATNWQKLIRTVIENNGRSVKLVSSS
jgi:hypothetical protein